VDFLIDNLKENVMAKNDREFKCESYTGENIVVGVGTGNVKTLKLQWERPSHAFRNVFLSEESCRSLVGQINSFLDQGRLLPEDPPEADSNAKATAKALLAAVGLEVDLDEIRVMQGTEVESR
jgi:hypothetical protein